MKLTIPADELATAASWATVSAARIDLTAPHKPLAGSTPPGQVTSRHALVPIQSAG